MTKHIPAYTLFIAFFLGVFMAGPISTAVQAMRKKKPENELEARRMERDSLKLWRNDLTAQIAEVEGWLAQNDPELKRTLPSVTVYELAPRGFSHFTEAHGSVKADENAMLFSSTGGQVRSILVRPGQQVSRGQRIVDIDVDALRQNVQQAEASAKLARTVYERQAKLWEQNIGSEVQYLEAKSRMESGEAQLAALRDQLRNAEITAPFNGIVDEIFPTVGDMVGPQMPVARVVSLGKASIEVDLTERMLSRVNEGDPVEVVLPETDEKLMARIDQIGSYINPNNRTFKVTVRVTEGTQLRPNQLANVRIRDMEAEDALVVPARLVMEDSKGQSYVFVLEERNGRALVRKEFVTILSTQGSELLLDNETGTLRGGERLVDKGARLVVNEQEVQVVSREA
jgi:membrane fusion protein, multidrug efflux system